MEDDLIALARICLQHARASKSPKIAAQLLLMAENYEHRAALLHSGTGPPKRRPVGISRGSVAPPEAKPNEVKLATLRTLDGIGKRA
jgi:hypothetical protein